MKQLTLILLTLLFPSLILAQEIDKKLSLIEYPLINSEERIKSIDAKTYQAKMIMNNYSQTKGELLDSEKIIYKKNGYITSKESERNNLDQKIILKVKSNNTDYSVTQKQGKNSSVRTTELTQQTPTSTLYTIVDIGVGVQYKTKEIHGNRVITTTQDQNKLILRIDTVEYNEKGYPLYQFTDVISDRQRVEYRHQYNENGWVTSTYIKTINILKNRDDEDVEEITTISQRYQYVYEDKFHNWLTRYTFDQNNRLMNITERRIDYY